MKPHERKPILKDAEHPLHEDEKARYMKAKALHRYWLTATRTGANAEAAKLLQIINILGFHSEADPKRLNVFVFDFRPTLDEAAATAALAKLGHVPVSDADHPIAPRDGPRVAVVKGKAPDPMIAVRRALGS